LRPEPSGPSPPCPRYLAGAWRPSERDLRASSSIEKEIEARFREMTGRECLFVPSGRVALWLALRCWLRPGDRLLMSPVTDDVVFFTVLAAGLRPVMAPVSACDGNIDPGAVPAEV